MVHAPRSPVSRIPVARLRRYAEWRGLTPRQLEVLRLISEGYDSKEIAERLYLAQDTVKGHMKETRRRLGARSQAHAVMLAVRRGLL